MKRLRHFCAATILTFTFTLAAFAGDMQCGVTSEPPPPESEIAGQMDTGASAETAVVDSVTGLALDILQGLLSLF